ncbi:MAG: MraY family glycosyltransferase, partial [Bacteroides sp.]
MELFETGIILMSPLLNMLICAVSFVVALMLEVIMLPRILLISKLKRLYDLPNARKHHRSPTLRLTGVTFFPILILSFLPLVGMQALLLNDSDFAYSSAFIFQFAFSLSGCLILVLLGIKNDLVRVRYSHKFLLQIMAACLLIASGTYIDNFQGLLGIYALPSFVVYPFNLLLIVYIINAINLINGVDGLTASLSCLAAGALGVLLLIQESYYYAPLAFAMVGMLIPLLFYSTSARRKTFMGDTGSLTLGYTLALLAVHYGSQESTM